MNVLKKHLTSWRASQTVILYQFRIQFLILTTVSACSTSLLTSSIQSIFYSVCLPHTTVMFTFAMNRIIHYVQGWLFLLRAPVNDWLVGNPSFDSFRLRRLSYRTAAGGDERITYRTKPNQKTGYQSIRKGSDESYEISNTIT